MGKALSELLKHNKWAGFVPAVLNPTIFRLRSNPKQQIYCKQQESWEILYLLLEIWFKQLITYQQILEHQLQDRNKLIMETQFERVYLIIGVESKQIFFMIKITELTPHCSIWPTSNLEESNYYADYKQTSAHPHKYL